MDSGTSNPPWTSQAGQGASKSVALLKVPRAPYRCLPTGILVG